MATNQEVIDAEIQVTDNIQLEKALDDLSAIFAGSGEVNFSIEREGIFVDFKSLKAVLKDGGANEIQMIADLDSSILTAIGATHGDAGSIRMAVKDLVVLHDADIAGT